MPQSPDTAPLATLADTLLAEGRSGDAHTLYAHILSLEPENLAARKGAAHSLSACGRPTEALRHLAVLKRLGVDFATLLRESQAPIYHAIETFNAHIAADELAEADACIIALLDLLPSNAAFLESGLALTRRLRDKDRAGAYAAALVRLDPTHYEARLELVRGCQARYEAPPTEDLLALVRCQPDQLHIVEKLQNIYAALSAVLQDQLDARLLREAETLLALAQAIPPARTEAEEEPLVGWEKHYRLCLAAIDLAAIVAATPEPSPHPPIAFANASGVALRLDELRATASQLRAEAVFFVAADSAYVARYAGLYAASVLRHCDVACLVIVHVIGGIGRLAETAASLAIDDARLIFSGDGFDPARVESRCYGAPPALWHGLAAHYQSARFVWLDYILEALALPVVVSDIDMLMQRGLRDLLEHHAGADVVFNCNLVSQYFCTRLTANLLLVNPTAAARRFARFLRSYLDRALQQSEVTDWIDQCALASARHHLLWNGAGRIAYFDTEADINNCIYKRYQPNPFRFLSLYNGFDLSSLAPAQPA